jgi:hypothetical protein
MPTAFEGRSYSNVTLTSLNGDLSVVVFMPKGISTNNDDDVYYYSSRFDHGSMIGSITRKRKFMVQDPQCSGKPDCPNKIVEREHILYGADAWRQPHNTHWPESGMGLASEFGVGDDGSFCYYRCGWYQENDVTNGVLGYQEAGVGQPFLKIGVGELLKGTCPTCDSTEDYKFNSPYLFASQPLWNLTYVSKKVASNNNLGEKPSQDIISSIRLDHEATLRNNPYGYALSKVIALNDRVLEVTSTLTNKGASPFSTAWYSHNFFTCDHTAVGPGYSADLNLQGTGHIIGGGVSSGQPPLLTPQGGSSSALPPLFDEPGTWSWTAPLLDFSRIKPFSNSVHIDMTRALDPGIRIKAEFTKDPNSDGGFAYTACQTMIQSSLKVQSADDPSRSIRNDPTIRMYAYNLYIERGTLSPEPQILIRNLQPNQSVTWTQRLVIQDVVADNEYIDPRPFSVNATIPSSVFVDTSITLTSFLPVSKVSQSVAMLLFGLCVTLLVSRIMVSSISRFSRRNRGYRYIDDLER